MGLPIRITLDDIRDLCRYFATKPTGTTIQEAKAVIDSRKLYPKKLNALKFWGLMEVQEGGRLKLTPDGRLLAKGGQDEKEVFLKIIKNVPSYNAIIERAAHRHEDSLNTTEIGAHWDDYFKADVSDNEQIIKDQAVCFFHVAVGANLGNIIPGRKGKATRMSFFAEELRAYVSGAPIRTLQEPDASSEHEEQEPEEEQLPTVEPPTLGQLTDLGQGIFIAHGKNKKPLEQLKKILDQFRIPYKVAVDEPNLGRPISGKVREVMRSCNCAILIFTADEEFRDKDGNVVWRPSENVVYELGATGFLYDNRIVILKEDQVSFPSNFSDIGYISFAHDQLESKSMDILKELIGLDIVKVST